MKIFLFKIFISFIFSKISINISIWCLKNSQKNSINWKKKMKRFFFRSVRKRPEKTELKKSTTQNSGFEPRKSSEILWNFGSIWIQILSSLELYRLLSNSNKTRKVSLHTLDYLEKVKIEWRASIYRFGVRISQVYESTDLYKAKCRS